MTLAIGGICLLLAWTGEPLASGLAWERAGILHGELWRLWSAHLVHYSVSHAAADTLVLLAMGWYAEPLVGSRRFGLLLAGATLVLSLALLALAPGLQEYRGASGLGVLTAVLGGTLAWRHHPASRLILCCAALGLASKTLWEAFAHTAAFTDLPPGVAVAWQSHLLGALLGACAAASQQRMSNREAVS